MTSYIARKLVASSPTARILGRGMLPLLNNPRATQIAPLLAKAGVSIIEPEQWYEQQRVLDVFASITASDGSLGEDLIAVGMSLIDAASLPPDIAVLEDAIRELPALYHSLHRDLPPEEGFGWEQSSPALLRLYVNTPYPDGFIYGYLYALVRRYNTRLNQFAVKPRIIDTKGQLSVFEFERQTA